MRLVLAKETQNGTFPLFPPHASTRALWPFSAKNRFLPLGPTPLKQGPACRAGPGEVTGACQMEKCCAKSIWHSTFEATHDSPATYVAESSAVPSNVRAWVLTSLSLAGIQTPAGCQPLPEDARRCLTPPHGAIRQAPRRTPRTARPSVVGVFVTRHHGFSRRNVVAAGPANLSARKMLTSPR